MIEIPTFSDVAFFTEQVTLEDIIYNLRFRYNAALDRYYLDLNDATDAPILSGIKLVCNTLLNRFSKDERNPTGYLTCQSLVASDQSPPSFGQLGQRVRLYYATLAELNAAEP